MDASPHVAGGRTTFLGTVERHRGPRGAADRRPGSTKRSKEEVEQAAGGGQRAQSEPAERCSRGVGGAARSGPDDDVAAVRAGVRQREGHVRLRPTRVSATTAALITM